ncbi:MAG: YraN family protein [Acidimicrobiia bacterium]|nr:YraN family protein [Acidimicrobiia bacterium]
MTSARQALGAAGEALVAKDYESRGYEVVARNWRCREGELDLVLRRNRTIVFCEVKTRSSDAFGSPAEAVTHTKRARIRRLAALWLENSDVVAREIRFDVAAVLGGEIELYEGAF